jgi:hypothetical protein
MIADAVDNLGNDSFWAKQLELDLWIHSVVEKV